MGDVVVASSAALAPPYKRTTPAHATPNIDPLEGVGNDYGDDYTTLKRLQRHLEYVRICLRRAC